MSSPLPPTFVESGTDVQPGTTKGAHAGHPKQMPFKSRRGLLLLIIRGCHIAGTPSEHALPLVLLSVPGIPGSKCIQHECRVTARTKQTPSEIVKWCAAAIHWSRHFRREAHDWFLPSLRRALAWNASQFAHHCGFKLR